MVNTRTAALCKWRKSPIYCQTAFQVKSQQRALDSPLILKSASNALTQVQLRSLPAAPNFFLNPANPRPISSVWLTCGQATFLRGTFKHGGSRTFCGTPWVKNSGTKFSEVLGYFGRISGYPLINQRLRDDLLRNSAPKKGHGDVTSSSCKRACERSRQKK